MEELKNPERPTTESLYEPYGVMCNLSFFETGKMKLNFYVSSLILTSNFERFTFWNLFCRRAGMGPVLRNGGCGLWMGSWLRGNQRVHRFSLFYSISSKKISDS